MHKMGSCGKRDFAVVVRHQSPTRYRRVLHAWATGIAAWLLLSGAVAATLAPAPKDAVALSPVYRFYNTQGGAHFYTISVDERDYVLTNLPGFALEGTAFYTSTQPTTDLQPIFRFYNNAGGVHFYTMSAAERDLVLTYAQFSYEGTAFYATPAAGSDRAPLYRFYNRRTGTHFYTISDAERDQVATYPEYVYEGVVFYVYASGNPAPNPNVPPKVTLTTSDTALVVPGSVTLTAAATDDDGTIATVAFYQGGNKIAELTQPPYVYTAAIPAAGTYTFVAEATDDKGARATSSPVSVVATGGTVTPNIAEAFRFLAQSSFGPTPTAVAAVQARGVAAYLEDQFTQPMSFYPDAQYTYFGLRATPDCNNKDPQGNNYPASAPQAICYRDNLTPARVQRQFFSNAVTQPDQLRQRVAWALSQLVVISTIEQDLAVAYVMARYQNILAEEAFGNFEDLLRRVTLSPAMGNWLDMVNNDKPNASGSRVPNENYAREVLQLFSIGVHELKTDGTPLLDAQGELIATYDQPDIKEFARVFTGWTYPSVNGSPPTAKNPAYYVAPMAPYPNGHDTNAKQLLEDFSVPAGQSIQKDLEDAIRNIFMHRNVGPFVGKQLIQRLVTSNPSPAYVARVAGAFNDNGQGVRGDMKTVLRAILLDPEARQPVTDPNFGQLREPVLMVTALLRTLNGTTDGVGLSDRTASLGQRVYTPPSVFNYYPAEFTIPGSPLAGPEFGIHNTASAVARSNLVYTLLYSGIGADPMVPNATGTRITTTLFEELAATPTAMVDKMNDLLLGGQLPAFARDIIVQSVSQVPAGNSVERARLGLYLMASSYHFQVQH
ncbi:MAG: DUF1800 family protein [Casimicrobiaceae bacterium]